MGRELGVLGSRTHRGSAGGAEADEPGAARRAEPRARTAAAAPRSARHSPAAAAPAAEAASDTDFRSERRRVFRCPFTGAAPSPFCSLPPTPPGAAPAAAPGAAARSEELALPLPASGSIGRPRRLRNRRRPGLVREGPRCPSAPQNPPWQLLCMATTNGNCRTLFPWHFMDVWKHSGQALYE